MLAALLLAAGTLGPPRSLQDDPRRQFDFWIGEWSVQNRDLQPDGSWKDGDVTRARITPVAGGNAILEEWAGPLRGAFMNGFSLRAWNPGLERWEIVLFWTVDGSSSFGRMAGSFRHGRGEFIAPVAGPGRTRYTFSDALADSVRWDSATTKDSGVSWRTDWIMEFSRTRAASEASEDELFATDWTEGALSPHPAARRLDWMLGTWTGTVVCEEHGQHEARLRSKLMNKDALVVDLLETRLSASDPWSGRLCVRGLDARKGSWEGWVVDDSGLGMAPLDMRWDEDVLDTRYRRIASEMTGELFVRDGEDVLWIEIENHNTRCAVGPTDPRIFELERVRDTR